MDLSSSLQYPDGRLLVENYLVAALISSERPLDISEKLGVLRRNSLRDGVRLVERLLGSRTGYAISNIAVKTCSGPACMTHYWLKTPHCLPTCSLLFHCQETAFPIFSSSRITFSGVG